MTMAVKVLVVDDSVTIRAMMMRVLEGDRDIKAVAVRSADEAEAALSRERFDVVTLDVQMPGRSGLDLLGDLVGHYKLPVIMLSASTGAGAEVRTKAFLAGAAGCFDKADAVRSAPALIRLVKNAASGRARIGADDKAAIAGAKAVA